MKWINRKVPIQFVVCVHIICKYLISFLCALGTHNYICTICIKCVHSMCIVYTIYSNQAWTKKNNANDSKHTLYIYSLPQPRRACTPPISAIAYTVQAHARAVKSPHSIVFFLYYFYFKPSFCVLFLFPIVYIQFVINARERACTRCCFSILGAVNLLENCGGNFSVLLHGLLNLMLCIIEISACGQMI